MGDLIVFFAALFVILQKDTIDAGTVGLSLSFALQVNHAAMLRNLTVVTADHVPPAKPYPGYDLAAEM